MGKASSCEEDQSQCLWLFSRPPSLPPHDASSGTRGAHLSNMKVSDKIIRRKTWFTCTQYLYISSYLIPNST